MSLKLYTINVAGSSEGNVIPSGFTIDVHQIAHLSEGETEKTQIRVCTKNATTMCNNDDIADTLDYALQAMSSSSNAIFTATIEVTLDAVYGEGNWSS
jgi:hypothetical protein